MVAAKLVTCKPGDNQHSAGARTSQAKAAKLLNVSADKVKRVAKVLKDGAPELRAAAEQGEISLTAAALVAHRPLEEQGEIITAGPKAVAKAAEKMRERRRVAAAPAKPEPADRALEQDDAPDTVSPAAGGDAPSIFDDDPAVAARCRREVLERIAGDEDAVEGEFGDVTPTPAEPVALELVRAEEVLATLAGFRQRMAYHYDLPDDEYEPDWFADVINDLELWVMSYPFTEAELSAAEHFRHSEPARIAQAAAA